MPTLLAVMLERLPIEGAKGALENAQGGALHRDALLAYMRGCPVVLTARTMVPDRFDPDAKRIPLAWYSDGVFAWTAETVAYVERYNVGLPSRFVAHVAARNAVVPSFTDAERAALVDAFRAGDPQAAC